MIVKELIRLRKEAGLSQHDLADKAGISRQSIAKYEQGVREISPTMSFRIKLACMGGDASELNRDQLLECISGLL